MNNLNKKNTMTKSAEAIKAKSSFEVNVCFRYNQTESARHHDDKIITQISDSLKQVTKKHINDPNQNIKITSSQKDGPTLNEDGFILNANVHL